MHAAVGRKEKYLATSNRPQLRLMDKVLASSIKCRWGSGFLTKCLIMIMCFHCLPCA